MLTRYSVFCGVLLLFLVTSSCRYQKPSRLEPANVMLILVDDLGYGDLAVTGSEYYETPNIDSLAKQAITFTQGYAASRVCSPSRASIMTGKYTSRHGITDWIGAKSGENWRTQQRHDRLLPAAYQRYLPAGETTLAEALQQHGYRTFYAGKWHLGGEGSYPEDHGFDFNKGGWEMGSPIGGYFSPWENPRLVNTIKGENLSMRLALETVDFLRENQQSRFLAILSFYAVHGPIQTTREKWSKFRQKAANHGIKEQGFQMERVLPIRNVQDNPIYAGLVESMDDAVGLVLTELQSLGLAKNTVVIFTSDNGGVASGDNYSTTNLPLRGGKGYQWEGGLRVPFFISVPGLGSGQSDYPVTGADLYPTILDLLNLELKSDQHLDGISLLPVMQGDSTAASRPLFWHYPHYGNQGGEPSSIIRFNEWKLIHYWEDGHDELYNLHSDPGEQEDILLKHPKVANELGDRLQNWLQNTTARFPLPDPEFDSLQAKKRKKYLREELWPQLENQRRQTLSVDFEPDSTWWGSEPTE